MSTTTSTPATTTERPHRPRRSRWLALVAVVVALGLGALLTGCDPTFQLIGGHPPCDAPLHFRINPAGFTTTELTDIVTAAGVITSQANVALQYDGTTSQAYATQDPRSGVGFILIEHRTTTYAGREATATASPWPDGNDVVRSGSIWFGPVADRLPAGTPLNGTWGSTYLKLALHEWSHLMGLADLDQSHPESMMSSATAPSLSDGDQAGLVSNGCYSSAERQVRLAQLGQ